MDVLFEKPGHHAGQVAGKSPYLQAVQVMAPTTLIGEIHPVTISEVRAHSLFGALTNLSHSQAREPQLVAAGG